MSSKAAVFLILFLKIQRLYVAVIVFLLSFPLFPFFFFFSCIRVRNVYLKVVPEVRVPWWMRGLGFGTFIAIWCTKKKNGD